MTDGLKEAMADSSNFTDPAKFEALQQAALGGEFEEASEEYEEPADEEEQEEQQEENEADEEQEEERALSPSEKQSVKFFKEQLKREQERSSKLEAQIAEVTAFLQKQYGKQEEPAQPEYEFIDDDAVKWAKAELAKRDDEIKKLSSQQEINAFQVALTHQEAAARAKYPDFDDAFKTYQERETKRFMAMGYPQEIAAQASNEAMHKLALAAWRQGHNLGDMFYGLAESMGYQGKGAIKKPQPNLDALERNQKRSGKKQADKITPDIGSSKSIVDSMKKQYDPKSLDADAQFEKLLAQARASVQ